MFHLGKTPGEAKFNMEKKDVPYTVKQPIYDEFHHCEKMVMCLLWAMQKDRAIGT